MKIKEAVRRAAAMLKGEAPKVKKPLGIIGANVQRIDVLDKVTGRASYAADLKLEGMLYARVLRSPHAHARILSIDTTKAEKLPGVAAVLTAKDIPGEKLVGMGKEMPVLAIDKACQLGDPVAVVAADTSETARKALALIKVDYQPLEAVFDPLIALREDAPQIHPKGNVMATRRIVKGDIAKGFREADVIVENTYTTPSYAHACMEPEAGISYLDEEGRVTVSIPTQGPHSIQKEIAAVLGVETDRVRVIPATVGGGFGGRGEVSIHYLLPLLTQKLRKPVKMVYTRRESFENTSKCPSFHIRYKMGATKEGKLTAVQVEIIINGGAYFFGAPVVLARASIHATGPYYVPNILVNSKVVYTNTPYGGQMRGFGVPQVALAHESQIELIANRLGIDPWQIRFMNGLRSGSKSSIGQVLGKGVAMRKTLEAVKPYYDKAVSLVRSQDGSSPV
ncbi:MAG: molybdopterin-dependent oxidoreductase, partial [Dehalococcoidia bacterium]|nr:molybdopterin-dependent oxidoreductase [Dehalococcoidia bacterium]